MFYSTSVTHLVCSIILSPRHDSYQSVFVGWVSRVVRY